MQTELRSKARDLGILPTKTLSFVIKHPKALSESLPKQLRAKGFLPAQFHVVFGREKERERTPPVVGIVALIGKEVNGSLVSVRKIESR